MSWYRRSKTLYDAIHNFSSPKPHFPCSNWVFGASYSSITSPLSKKSGFLFGSKQYPFNTTTTDSSLGFVRGRRYYVDRNQVRHFRPRGPRKWFQSPRNLLVVTLAGSTLVVTVYFGNLETIPYTKRTHFILLSQNLEKRIGDSQFNQIKSTYKGKILPAIHPDSVRVRLIAKEIIEALQRGLKKERVWTDVDYASEPMESGGSSNEPVLALTETMEGKWSKEDEILDDKWVQQSRKEGQERGKKSMTSHLESLNWEILVVNEPVVNAFCLPGGKIVVFTGLLQHFKTNEEIATIIGHEVCIYFCFLSSIFCSVNYLSTLFVFICV